MPTPSEPAFTEAWIRRFAASASAVEPELAALDQQVGDGDFGANLVAGLQATLHRLDGPLDPDGAVPRAVDAVGPSDGFGGPDRLGGPAGRPGSPEEAPSAAARPLEAAAAAFLDEVGGTSGPLFGLLFQEMALAVRAAGDDLVAKALATGAASGLAAIERVGEASVGDKTLVDALVPACAALAAHAPVSGPAEALRHAAEAAWQGVADTARLTARRGRASYLGDRAAGVPDPGAVGVALLFSAADGTVRSLAPLLAGVRPAASQTGRPQAAAVRHTDS